MIAITSNVIKSYRDLIIWRKAIALVFETYRVSRAFPPDERFGLTAQIRRAAVSIAANIAEGHGRRHHRAEYRRFLAISRGSVMELETYLVISEGLDFVRPEDLQRARSLCDEVSRMASGIQRKLGEERGVRSEE